VSAGEGIEIEPSPRPYAGQPSMPIVIFCLCPNCSAVTIRSHDPQRFSVFSSSSEPPWASGTMWLTILATSVRGDVRLDQRLIHRQRSHSPFVRRKRLNRWACPALPLRRSTTQTTTMVATRAAVAASKPKPMCHPLTPSFVRGGRVGMVPPMVPVASALACSCRSGVVG
jgi:hypothetical protein